MGEDTPTTRRNIVIGVIVLVAGAGAWWYAQRQAPETVTLRGFGAYGISDTKAAYYGNTSMFRRPAEIAADTIYAQIPEFQEIQRRGLSDGKAEYHVLLTKASARFNSAVKLMAAALDHDFVAERGAILLRKADATPPPDRTQEVLAQLR